MARRAMREIAAGVGVVFGKGFAGGVFPERNGAFPLNILSDGKAARRAASPEAKEDRFRLDVKISVRHCPARRNPLGE